MKKGYACVVSCRIAVPVHTNKWKSQYFGCSNIMTSFPKNMHFSILILTSSRSTCVPKPLWSKKKIEPHHKNTRENVNSYGYTKKIKYILIYCGETNHASKSRKSKVHNLRSIPTMSYLYSRCWNASVNSILISMDFCVNRKKFEFQLVKCTVQRPYIHLHSYSRRSIHQTWFMN